MADTSPDPDDRTLLNRMREGDADAFAVLFDRHVPLMSARVRRMLSPSVRRRVAVSDVIQEARITALRRSRDFDYRGDAELRNWLLRIAELKARSAARRHAGTAKRAAGAEVDRERRVATEDFASREPSPSQSAIALELVDVALLAMKALPRDHQEVLRLTRIEGLTFAEAAGHMRRSPAAVKKLYGRAFSRFAEVFDSMTRR